MALEIEEEKGKGKEIENKAEASLQADQLKLIQDLQKQVDDLQNKNTSSSESDSEKLMRMLVDKLAINQNANMPKTGQFEFDTMHTSDDIDSDDMLEEKDWVTFVTHRVMYLIVDDKRNGKNIRAPFDKILFKYQFTRRIPNGKETDIVNLSMYVCKSKTELDWLKAHSMYNIMFFENINDALSADVDKASRLARQMNALRNVGQHQLASLARQRDVPVVNDINKLRALIAHAVVDEQIRKERGLTEKILMEQKAEQDILESAGNG